MNDPPLAQTRDNRDRDGDRGVGVGVGVLRPSLSNTSIGFEDLDAGGKLG